MTSVTHASSLVVRIEPVPPPLKKSSATPRSRSRSATALRLAATSTVERRLTKRFIGLSSGANGLASPSPATCAS